MNGVPPNLYVGSPIPNVTIFGDGAFKGVTGVKWCHKSEAVNKRTEALRGREKTAGVRSQWEGGRLQPRKRPLESHTCQQLDLGLQPPELWDNTFLWYFVTAALVHQFWEHKGKRAIQDKPRGPLLSSPSPLPLPAPKPPGVQPAHQETWACVCFRHPLDSPLECHPGQGTWVAPCGRWPCQVCSCSWGHLGLSSSLTLCKNKIRGTSLVAQWLRICLPMQGTRVRALVREDPTCRRAIKPVRHNYWACALEPASHNYWSPRTWSPCSTREATAMRSPCA